MLVGDETGEVDVVDLVGLPVRLPHLRHHDLDLVGLEVVGEHGRHGLGVGVGQRTGGDVLAVVRVALHVGQTDAGLPERLELGVLAHAGEGDAVVDLGDLAQVPRRVLRHDEDPLRHFHGNDGTAAGDVGRAKSAFSRVDVSGLT